MMADLMDQHMTHQTTEILVAFAPVIEQGTAIKKDHVDILGRIHDAALVNRHALIQTQQIERAFERHVSANFRIGELLDTDYDIARHRPKARGNSPPGCIGVRFDIAQ